MKGYITSSTLHRSFIDPFIDPSSTLHQPKTTPRPPKDQDKTAHSKSIDFSSTWWFGADVGHGHFYRESLCENDNSMKQEMHKCRFLIKMLIWPWQWRWALLQRILAREWEFYETRDAQMQICPQNDDLALPLAMGTFTENRCTRMTILWNKRCTNDFSSKCWFGVPA